jgi:hypothetical protein
MAERCGLIMAPWGRADSSGARREERADGGR